MYADVCLVWKIDYLFTCVWPIQAVFSASIRKSGKVNNPETMTKLFSTPRPKFEDKTRMTRAVSNIEYEDEDETIEKGTF